MRFPLTVVLKYKTEQYWPLHRWCSAHIGYRDLELWNEYKTYDSSECIWIHIFEFKNQEDLVAFQLVWC